MASQGRPSAFSLQAAPLELSLRAFQSVKEWTEPPETCLIRQQLPKHSQWNLSEKVLGRGQSNACKQHPENLTHEPLQP